MPLSGEVIASGGWAYQAAADGTLTVPSGARLLGVAAHATTAGSFTIDGGDSIPVPANVGVEFNPHGNKTGPFDVTATGTDVVIVEYVT